MESSKNLDIFDYLMGVILIAMILLAPLPYGSMAPWSKSVLLFFALLMTGLWLIRGAQREHIGLCPSPLWIFLALALMLVGIQLAPLAPNLLKQISPATAELYTKTLEGYPAGGEARTLSQDAHTTTSALAQWAILAVILVIVINAIRTRIQILILVLALVAVGVFEAVYGLVEHLSHHNHIFWNERQSDLKSVTGTFQNKDQFAALLGMLVPLVLGLFVVAKPIVDDSRSAKRNRHNTFSRAGTYYQILLGICFVVLMFAIFYSLSWVGILCAMASWAVFVILLVMNPSLRKCGLTLVVMGIIVLVLVIAMNAKPLLYTFETEFSGDPTPWSGRIGLWGSGLALFADYPWLGTGLGTFPNAFERFHTMRFGGRYADFLHNDWVRFFCDTGLAGGILALTGCLTVGFYLVRKTLSRRDHLCHWMALAGMVSTGTMLLHSTVNSVFYNLASNGIVFAAILGLWHAVLFLPRRETRSMLRYWEIPIHPRIFSWVGAGLLLLAMFWPAAWAMRSAKADIFFNHFLSSPLVQGKAQEHHFLKINEEKVEKPIDNIEAALTLDPNNGLYYFYAALSELKQAEKNTQAQAFESARKILGPEIETIDPPGFKKVVEALSESLDPQAASENKPRLKKAEILLRKAISLSPGIARYHLTLASVIVRLRSVQEAVEVAELAIWLSNNKPSILFEAGKIFVAKGKPFPEGAPDKNALDFAADCFRYALCSDPSYLEPISSIVHATMTGKKALASYTSQDISRSENPMEILEMSDPIEGIITCLNASLSLMKNDLSEKRGPHPKSYKNSNKR